MDIILTGMLLAIGFYLAPMLFAIILGLIAWVVGLVTGG